MKFTDKEAIKALERANVCELFDMIADYPEEDRDGRSDFEMSANEAGWLLDAFNSFDTAHNEDLLESRRTYQRLIRVKQKRGFLTTHEYIALDSARYCMNEYNRLTGLVKRLKAMGLYCPYC